MQRGETSALAQAVLQMGLSAPVVTFGTGMGLRDKLGLLRITIPADKDVLHLVVARQDAQEAFDFMTDVARLHQPGRGFIYISVLRFGVINTCVSRGEVRHVAGSRSSACSSRKHQRSGADIGEFVRLARKQQRGHFTSMAYDSAVQAVGLLGNILFLWVGAGMVVRGGLSIGAFVAFNALVPMALGPVLTALGLWDEVQISAVLLDRLEDVFDTEPEQGSDRSSLQPVPRLQGRVELANAGFRYGGPESTPILSAISLEVPAGRTVAIVGRSGSGKTTLAKCLAGLIESTTGSIRFDGMELRTLDYRELRRQVGTVLQQNYIFDDTILRNIAFGDPDPDRERVIRAARLANAHDFIRQLPLGYETPIGESGLRLSGGQQQRVAIARALYGDPPMLIFDEATSALDTESERAIQENMASLLAGRTAFVIAHRLSTIRNADLIVVLEQGRIAERGSHEELMERRGLYHCLCSQQVGL